MPLARRLVAESLGTYFLVFAGTGAVVIHGMTGAITHVGIALTFGLVVMALIYALGESSGAHFNPAVTISFVLAGRFSARDAGPYVLAQVTGALAASGTLWYLFPEDGTLGSTLPRGSAEQSLILEMILTWFLMLVILCVSSGAKEKGLTAGIVIGAVIALEAMFAGPICGASMNPARSLAPAVVSGQLQYTWIYLLGPIAGAILAIPTYHIIKPLPESVDEEKRES
jgi:aquaporin Z